VDPRAGLDVEKRKFLTLDSNSVIQPVASRYPGSEIIIIMMMMMMMMMMIIIIIIIIIMSRDRVTIDGGSIGNPIYWTLKEIVTTFYKLISHRGQCSPSRSSPRSLVAASERRSFLSFRVQRLLSSLAGTFPLQLPS
jgi:hypothetical protein